MNWIWIEPYGLSPDELLDVLFSKRGLLKIKIERHWADRLLVDIMKRRQVWVGKSLINYKVPERKTTVNAINKDENYQEVKWLQLTY